MLKPSNVVLLILASSMLLFSVVLVVQINLKTDDRFRAKDFAREIAKRDAKINELQIIIRDANQGRAVDE